MRVKLLIYVLLALFAVSGCATFKEIKGKDYRDSAKLNFDEGVKYLKAEEYEIAEKYFSLVQSKFTFSMYSKTSELLVADTFYLRDMFAEAIDYYKKLQRSHPEHACVPYTQFMAGESHFEQVSEDWWFMPPVYEKDQKTTEKAMVEYQRLLYMLDAEGYKFEKDYEPPKLRVCTGMDTEQERAYAFVSRKKIRYCLRRLVDREVYVAHFYMDRDKPLGAIGRLEDVRKRYPAVNDDLEVLMLSAEAYEAARQFDKAIEAWKMLKEIHSKKPEVKDIDLQKKLAQLEKDKLSWQESEKKRIAEERERMTELKAKDKRGEFDVE